MAKVAERKKPTDRTESGSFLSSKVHLPKARRICKSEKKEKKLFYISADNKQSQSLAACKIYGKEKKIEMLPMEAKKKKRSMNKG